MFDEINLIFYRLVMLVYKKKKVDDAINLRKVTNKKFPTNQINQLEEYLIDLGSTTNHAVKMLYIAPEKIEDFAKVVSRS